MLRCPVCKDKLARETKTFRCPKGHSFDVASQGYINLKLSSSANTGDNKDMIRARTAFLYKDHYNFLRNRLKEIIDGRETLIDLACGEGYYTQVFSCGTKIGIDLSKEGLKVASKKDKSTQYVLSSIFQNPLFDECTDTVLTCFAPIAREEIVRILKKDGIFVLVKPGRDHLFELKEAVYDEPYLNEVEDTEIEGLTKTAEYTIKDEAVLDNQELKDLFTMTPYYIKTSRKDAEKLDKINELKVTFQFIIDVYTKQ